MKNFFINSHSKLLTKSCPYDHVSFTSDMRVVFGEKNLEKQITDQSKPTSALQCLTVFFHLIFIPAYDIGTVMHEPGIKQILLNLYIIVNIYGVTTV